MTDANILPHCVALSLLLLCTRCVLHVTFEDESTQRVSSDGQSVWLQIGENDIITLSDMVNNGWRWSSDCPRQHTHIDRQTHTHTHTAYNYTQTHDARKHTSDTLPCHLSQAADLLVSPHLPTVSSTFATVSTLITPCSLVVQTNTSVPPGFSPCVSAALWATWLTDGKDSDKVTVPKRRGKKENVSSVKANSISNSAIWGLVGDKYSAFVYCVFHYNDSDRFSRGCCCQIKNKKSTVESILRVWKGSFVNLKTAVDHKKRMQMLPSSRL